VKKIMMETIVMLTAFGWFNIGLLGIGKFWHMTLLKMESDPDHPWILWPGVFFFSWIALFIATVVPWYLLSGYKKTKT
jgi:hypothetical protein